MYYVGIDIGSVACKGVLFREDMLDKKLIATGWNPQQSGKNILSDLLADNEISQEDLKAVVVTGYGRVSQDFADKTITEITCHAKGAYYLNPEIRTIIDIGGQDSKAIALDQSGNVQDFIMNDKCAAGTGKFLEVTVNSLGESIEDLDQLIQDDKKADISSMCTVFAESEIISLLAAGSEKSEIAAGIVDSIADRMRILLAKIDLKGQILFTGGLAQSQVIKDQLSQKLNKEILSHTESQFAGAIGAALLAKEIK